MKNPFKKQKFPKNLFIAISLTALISLPVFLIFFNSMFTENSGIKSRNATGYRYDTSDPFITKVLKFENFITKPIINNTDPALGNPNAPIAVVQFSDFECEYCKKQEKELKKLLMEYKDKIKLIWKDYPMNNTESPSYQAAVAARCAAEQDNFWTYHDLLFEESHNLNLTTFNEIAQELKLNLKKFKKCLNSSAAEKLINENIKEANALNITGIPFIFINDQEIMGEIDLEELKEIIELELNK